MADGKVVIDTGLNNKGLKSDINGISGAFGGLKNVLGKIGGLMSSVFAVGALVNFGKQAIDLGSDFAEVQNVVDVSFGAMSAACEDFAESAIMNFGMSELAAKRTSSTYMAMAKGLGVADEAARDMSINLAGLSGDVASFFNLDQEVAAKKLQGIFTGETEALKELGVVMTQANLKQFAMEKGMNANIEAMSQAELVSLRYAFVTEALNLAAGDFARTQDSWANQTRILSMQWESFMSTIGQTLTTILLPAVEALNSMLSSLIGIAQQLNSFVNGLFGIEQAGEAAASAGAGFGAAAGSAEDFAEATEKAGKAAKSLAGFDEINKITEPGGGSSGSVGGFDSSIPSVSTAVDTSIEDISAKLQPIVSYIQSVVARVRAMLAPLKEIDFSASIESIKVFFSTIASFGEEVWSDLEWVWFNILEPLASWSIEEHGPESVDLLTEAIKPLTTALQETREGWQNLVKSLQPAIDWIKNTASWIVQQFKENFQRLGSVFKENGGEISETLTNIGIIFGVVWRTVLQPLLEKIKKAFEVVFGFIRDISSGTLGDVIQLFSGLVQFVAGVLTLDFKKALNGIIKMFNALLSNMITGLNGLIGALNRLSFDIPDWVPSIGGKSFGLSIPKLSAPQIPYLAKGAVIPPNAPFMAVLGDQRHGQNIEAPLSTIQEAVATVMEDYSAANMAGHGATVAVLREILEAVLGIEIGDDVIANAVNRYQTKMAIVRGG